MALSEGLAASWCVRSGKALVEHLVMTIRLVSSVSESDDFVISYFELSN